MAAAWKNYKAKMAKKRCKTTKEDCSNTKMEELVVQRLSTTVSGKAQKYTRVGAREFVAFDYDEVNIAYIKKACAEHYGSSIGDDMEVDVLAGEQGPSCQTMKHVKDLRLIYIRFIQRETSEYYESLAGTSAAVDNDRVLSSKKTRKDVRNIFSDSHVLNRQQHLCTGNDPELSATKEGNVFSVYPNSLSIADMLKLGKVVSESPAIVIEVSTFCTSSMSWSKVKQSVEFIIDKTPLGEGGFRVAFKASCSTPLDAFNGKSWVVKKFLPKTLEAVQFLNQTPEQPARRVVQMHCLYSSLFCTTIYRANCKGSCNHFVFQKVYLSGEVVTIEEFINGTFTKYINNTGFLCVPEDNVIGQKAETFVHFSYMNI